MSAVRSCPKCSSRVAAPWGAADEQWVRCPICGAEYRVGDVLEFDPPALVLIDEPVVPAEGKLPQWAAMAAPAADYKIALPATEVAAPTGDLPEVELLVPPPTALGEAVTSDQTGDDTEVITFDDSLLLDESTDASPGQTPPNLPAALPLAAPLSEDDFFKVISAGDTANGTEETVSELDWPEDDNLEPYQIDDDATDPVESTAELNADADQFAPSQEQVAVFDSASVTDKARSSDFGLPPRRRSRRGSPVMMLVGYVGGGVLGLAIGYAILMWGFSKDPFDLGPKLPGLLVPAALRSANTPRVVQYAPSTEDTPSDPEPNAADPNDQDPLFPPIEPAPTNGAASNSTPDTATKTDDATESQADTASTQEPSANTAPTEAAPTEVAPAQSSQATAITALLPTGDAQELGPIAKRHYLVDDLLGAVRAAQPTTEAAVTLPRDAPQPRKLEVNGAYYTNLSKIAEALTHLDANADPAAREKALDAAIAAFLDAAPTSQQLAELGKLGGYWFANPRGNGIVLAGTVKDAKPAGKLYESTVEPLGGRSGDNRAITVVSPAPLTDDSNRVVLVAGTIVDRPAENLRGYQGAAKRVVWGAMAIDPLSSRGKE